MKHRIRSASLVVRDEKLLLVRHLARRADADYCIPPGGGMKRSDASVFACAERETLEETGVRVRGSKILYLREFIDHVYEVREMEFFILADTADGEAAVREIPLSGSDLPFVTEVGWFPKEKLQSMTVYPECLKTEFWDDRNSSPIQTRHLGTDIRKKREANQPVDSTSASAAASHR